MLLVQYRQPWEDRRATCSSCSLLCALTAGNESTSGNPALCLPYYLSDHLSYPSLDFRRLYRLYRHYHHLCHPSLQRVELLERAHSLSWLQLPFRPAWWRSHRRWPSSWRLCPSWAPGRLATRRSLGFPEGGRRCVPAYSSWQLSVHSHRCWQRRCHWSLALCRDCNPWHSDRSAMHSSRHLRSPVAWCSKGLP